MLDGFLARGKRVWHLGWYYPQEGYADTLCGREIWCIEETDLRPGAVICANCRKELEKLLGGRYEIRERAK